MDREQREREYSEAEVNDFTQQTVALKNSLMYPMYSTKYYWLKKMWYFTVKSH